MKKGKWRVIASDARNRNLYLINNERNLWSD